MQLTILKGRREMRIAAIAVGCLLLLTLGIALVLKQNQPQKKLGNSLEIVSVSPKENQRDVSVYSPTIITFNRAVPPQEQAKIELNFSPVYSGQSTWSQDQTTLTMTPATTAPFNPGKKYTGSVSYAGKSYKWSFTIAPLDKATTEEKMKLQTAIDQEYADWQKSIDTQYPWLNKLPLQTKTYFVYFDTEKNSFVAKLYTKENPQPLKTEIIEKLHALDIPANNYPFEWEVN